MDLWKSVTSETSQLILFIINYAILISETLNTISSLCLNDGNICDINYFKTYFSFESNLPYFTK